MPRMVKWEEKKQCAKPKPVKLFLEENPIAQQLKMSLEDFIDKAIEEALRGGFPHYEDFVDIKEVPNG